MHRGKRMVTWPGSSCRCNTVTHISRASLRRLAAARFGGGNRVLGRARIKLRRRASRILFRDRRWSRSTCESWFARFLLGKGDQTEQATGPESVRRCCTCENRVLDDEENHVCQLKLPVEKGEGEAREYDSPVRYRDGSVRLRNPNIELMDQDILYHLALGSGSHDLVEMFGDVKFVCMGGTPKRMEQFAHYIMKEIGHKLPAGTTLLDISRYSYRYSMYKVGPVLSISHGMGIPSVGILLHEVIKLMYHAKVRDPVFFRIGTCGGIGLEGGTVVISEEAVDGMMKPYLELPVLGKLNRRPAKLDRQLARELKALAHRDDPYETVVGKTMCTYDFYEGQARLDGAFCEYTENDKMEYLNKVHKAGVVNIEMESLSFGALTHHAGIQSAVVCVTLLDRLKGDQVLAPKEVLDEWQIRPQQLIARYITKYLQRKGRLSLEGHGSMCVKSPRRYKLVQQESETYD